MSLKIHPPTIVIRKAVKENAADIQKILRISFNDYMKASGISSPLEAMLEGIEDIESDIANKDVDVFVACLEEAPIGTVRVTLLNSDAAILMRFGVISDYQKMGIGASLLQAVEKSVQAKNVKTLQLYTAAKNTALMKFYYDNSFYVDALTKDRGYTRVLMIKQMTE